MCLAIRGKGVALTRQRLLKANSHVFVYIALYLPVCVCMWGRERERERERERVLACMPYYQTAVS